MPRSRCLEELLLSCFKFAPTKSSVHFSSDVRFEPTSPCNDTSGLRVRKTPIALFCNIRRRPNTGFFVTMRAGQCPNAPSQHLEGVPCAPAPVTTTRVGPKGPVRCLKMKDMAQGARERCGLIKMRLGKEKKECANGRYALFEPNSRKPKRCKAEARCKAFYLVTGTTRSLGVLHRSTNRIVASKYEVMQLCMYHVVCSCQANGITYMQGSPFE